MPVAGVIAHATGASLTLLQVITDKRRCHEVRNNLERVANELATAELSVDTVVREGSAGEQILDEIDREGADLVIMCTHGRVGPLHGFGRRGQRVLSGSTIPLLVVRPVSAD